MAFTSADWLVMFVFGLSMGVTLGFVIGSRRGLRDRQRLQRDVNRAELKALDHATRAQSVNKLQLELARRERLQNLLLRRLKRAETRALTYLELRESDVRRHVVQTARYRLLASRMQKRAEHATALAQHATVRLKRLENSCSHPSVITALGAQAGDGEAAATPSDVIEQNAASAPQATLNAVPHRDTARLSRMHASNEACRIRTDNLQAIRGIDTAAEKSLNAAGIHRLEQLARLNEHELRELESRVVRSEQQLSCSEWALGARRLLRQHEPS